MNPTTQASLSRLRHLQSHLSRMQDGIRNHPTMSDKAKLHILNAMGYQYHMSAMHHVVDEAVDNDEVSPFQNISGDTAPAMNYYRNPFLEDVCVPQTEYEQKERYDELRKHIGQGANDTKNVDEEFYTALHRIILACSGNKEELQTFAKFLANECTILV